MVVLKLSNNVTISSVSFLHNTKPALSLCRTFSRGNNRTKNRTENKIKVVFLALSPSTQQSKDVHSCVQEVLLCNVAYKL